MTTPVVCGVDFSESSRRALVMAGTLAARLDQPLIVVTVVESLLAQAAATMHTDSSLRSRVQGELQRWAATAASAPPSLELRVEVGQPADRLVSAAAEAHASMVVMATQGFGPTKRLWLGSTTQRVMRTGRVAVLAVPPGALGESPDPAGLPFHRIICGVDFSDASTEATRSAVRLAHALKIPLLLIHAIDAPAVPSILMELAESVARRRLTEASARLRKSAAKLDVEHITVETQIGEPAAVLTQRANEPGAPALVVLGLGGNDPNARPGTTAFGVLTDARTPVLAVPAGARVEAHDEAQDQPLARSDDPASGRNGRV